MAKDGNLSGEGVLGVLHAIGLKQVRPAVLVIAPVAVLSLISASILAVLLGQAGSSTGAILSIGGALYAVAVVLLIRFGLANIGKLEDLGLTDSLAAMSVLQKARVALANAPPEKPGPDTDPTKAPPEAPVTEPEELTKAMPQPGKTTAN